MNRLPPSYACRVCGLDLLARHDRSIDTIERLELRRQAYSGMCDGCQRARQDAAIAFMRAFDQLRLIWPIVEPVAGEPQFRDAIIRLSAELKRADALCVELKMWPATRPGPDDKFHDPGYLGRRRTWGTEKETE